MRKTATRASIAVLALAFSAPALRAQEHHAHGQGHAAIPDALRHEHEEIQHALQEAVKAPREVGAAARDLQRVLTPHFEREEQIALPPLGVLQRLIEREAVSDLEAWLLPMTDSLRAELPRMLAEHKVIREAVQNLERTAVAAHDDKVAQLARTLAVHAQAEEEMYYPMAVLTGEIVRARLKHAH